MISDCTVSYILCPSLEGDSQRSVDQSKGDSCSVYVVTDLRPRIDGTFALTQSKLDTIGEDLRKAANVRLTSAVTSAGEIISRGQMVTEVLKSGEAEVRTLNASTAYKDSVCFTVDLVETQPSEEKAKQKAEALVKGTFYTKNEQRVRDARVTADRS